MGHYVLASYLVVVSIGLSRSFPSEPPGQGLDRETWPESVSWHLCDTSASSLEAMKVLSWMGPEAGPESMTNSGKPLDC